MPGTQTPKILVRLQLHFKPVEYAGFEVERTIQIEFSPSVSEYLRETLLELASQDKLSDIMEYLVLASSWRLEVSYTIAKQLGMTRETARKAALDTIRAYILGALGYYNLKTVQNQLQRIKERISKLEKAVKERDFVYIPLAEISRLAQWLVDSVDEGYRLGLFDEKTWDTIASLMEDYLALKDCYVSRWKIVKPILLMFLQDTKKALEHISFSAIEERLQKKLEWAEKIMREHVVLVE